MNPIIRNAYHIYLGISISYLIYTLTGASEFTDEGKLFGVMPLSALFGFGINFLFNAVQWYYFKIKENDSEAWMGATGGIFGGVLAIFMPNVWTAWIMFLSALVIAVYDLKNTKKQ